jgi:GTP-binding protein
MVSTEDWDGDVKSRFVALQGELAKYDSAMTRVPQLAVLTKTDLVDDETRDRMLAELREVCGHKPMSISAVTGDGLMPLVRRTFKVLEHLKAREDEAEEVAT